MLCGSRLVNDTDAIRKLIGRSASAIAFIVLALNVITYLDLGYRDPIDILAEASVFGVAGSCILALLTAVWRSRWSQRIQVAAFLGTALLSASSAKGGDLTSALPLILAFVLSIEYRFGKRSSFLVAGFMFIAYPIALASGYRRYSAAYLSQAAAGIAGLAFFVIIFRAILRRHQERHREEEELLESRVRERTQELETLSAERAAMLKELHHRVRNNLQLMASLLRLDADGVRDAEARRPLERGVGRIDAIALAHDSLYLADRLDLVDLERYASSLLTAASLESTPQRKIILEASGGPRLPLEKAVCFGLVLLDYTASDGDAAFYNGALKVRLASDGRRIELGLSPFEGAVPPRAGSRVADALIDQLGGAVEAATGGTILIRFPVE